LKKARAGNSVKADLLVQNMCANIFTHHFFRSQNTSIFFHTLITSNTYLNMYKLTAIAIALLAFLESSAAYDKPITLRRLRSSATRHLQSSAPVATSAPVAVVKPLYIPHRVKAGKRQLVHYKAPYEF